MWGGSPATYEIGIGIESGDIALLMPVKLLVKLKVMLIFMLMVVVMKAEHMVVEQFQHHL